MAMAALASRGSDEELRESQYKVLELWQQSYARIVEDHAAGYVWDDTVFAGRAGLGGGLDWAADRLEGPGCSRR